MEPSVRDKYTVVIGLEVHAQLLTNSKIFTSDSTAYGSAPNTNVSTITLGHPGTLPRLNKQVVEHAIKMGLACHSEISRQMIFDRKNYFYPDLPKGYQLTQDRTPICMRGHVTVTLQDGTEKDIPLNRIHLEEDAGKSIHLEGEIDTLVDFNRSGVPLIEIVTEPELRSSEEAHAFLNEIRRLVRYLDICDGNMEEGSLRCDANVSVMLKDADRYGKKVEIKNMNSMRNVKHAIDHEIERQIKLLEAGESISSETRTFNPATGLTYGMRTKEELNDYRYFPDPDLSPVHVSVEWLNEIRNQMPELPRDLITKFVEQYNIPVYDARILTETKEMADFFERSCENSSNYKAISNWLMGPVKSYLNDQGIDITGLALSPKQLAELVQLIDENKVSYTVASQQLLPELIKNPSKNALQIAQELNLVQDSDEDTISEIIDSVLAENAEKVKAYKSGKKGLIGMFMGEIMKKSKGKADPKISNQLLRKKLD